MVTGNLTTAFCGVLFIINILVPAVSSAALTSSAPTQQMQTYQLESVDPNKPAQTDNMLRIDIMSAILMAMENNKSLIVERMSPQIVRTFEDEEVSQRGNGTHPGNLHETGALRVGLACQLGNLAVVVPDPCAQRPDLFQHWFEHRPQRIGQMIHRSLGKARR